MVRRTGWNEPQAPCTRVGSERRFGRTLSRYDGTKRALPLLSCAAEGLPEPFRPLAICPENVATRRVA